MATVLGFSVCQRSNCKGITFTETTGVYSTSNTTGWGSPNQLTSDATAATLLIESYDSTTNTYTTLSTTNLFTSSFPSSTSTQEIFLDSTYFGEVITDAIPDGIYVFTYTVTTSTTTYTQKKKAYFYCEAKCCVYGMFPSLDVCECDCDDARTERAALAMTFYMGLKWDTICTNDAKFNEILDLLARLCSYEDCSTCN